MKLILGCVPIRRLFWAALIVATGLLAMAVPADAGTILFHKNSGLWRISDRGGQQRLVARNVFLFGAGGVNARPAAPNGRRVLFCVGNRKSVRMYTSDVRGKHRRRAGPQLQVCNAKIHLSWASDSLQVSLADSSGVIQLLRRPDGRRLRRVWRPSRSELSQGAASFSPRGRSLVFALEQEGEGENDKYFDLYVVGRDGRGGRKITNTPSTSDLVLTRPGDFSSYACRPGAQEEYSPLWARAGIVTVVGRCGPGTLPIFGLAFLDTRGRLIRDLIAPAARFRQDMAVALSPDGRRVAVLEKGVLQIINSVTGARRTMKLRGAYGDYGLGWTR